MTNYRLEKCLRALELLEKGISPSVIAERLGVGKSHIYDMIKKARAQRNHSTEGSS